MNSLPHLSMVGELKKCGMKLFFWVDSFGLRAKINFMTFAQICRLEELTIVGKSHRQFTDFRFHRK